MEFEKSFKIEETMKIAISIQQGVLIENVQDALDMLGNGGQYNCSQFILYQSNFPEAFYNLKSGLAGEILQKFSNYSVRVSLVGDFKQGFSERFKEFIYECNLGNQIYFTDDINKAISWLTLIRFI